MKPRHETDASQRAITELTQGLQSLLTLIQALLVERREESLTLAALKVEMAHLQKRLDSVARLVRSLGG